MKKVFLYLLSEVRFENKRRTCFIKKNHLYIVLYVARFHPDKHNSGSTMNGAAPLLPHSYTSAQKRDTASMNQSMSGASVPVTKIGISPLLGPDNTLCECPFCNASIKTAVQYSTTSRTHMAAALWCLACCLCCIPYGSDSAKNADHYCPSCHRYLGTYEK